MAWNPTPTLGPTSWSGNPQVALTSQLLSSTSSLTFGIQSSINYTTLTSNALQTQINDISGPTGAASGWSLFPAVSTVTLKNNYLISTSIVANSIGACNITIPPSGTLTGNVIGNVTGSVTGSVNGPVSGNVTGNVTGNLTGNVVGNISNTNLTLGGKYSITQTVDVGSAVADYANYANLNLTAKGGLGGLINITADVATPINPLTTVSQLKMEAKGNYGLITPGTPVGYVPRGGLVQITARQGLTPTPPAEATSILFANGEIDLTAYSYGTMPGLIKLAGGANSMVAGAGGPAVMLFGQNYIVANTGNCMIAGSIGTIPILVATNYFYGGLGIGGYSLQICGNRMEGGLAVDFLQPFPNKDLYIRSNANGTDTIIMRGIKSIAMSNAGNITNVGDIGLTTINGAAYPPIGNQTFTSVSTINISSGSAYFSSINGYSFASLVPNTQYVSSILTSSGTVVSGTTSTQNLLLSSINGGNLTQPYISTLSISSGTVASGTTSTQNLLVSSINGAPVVPLYLSSLSLSTGTVRASRIDAISMYVSTLFVSTSYTTNTIDVFASTTSLTTDAIFTSSIQVTGGLRFLSTFGTNYDISHNFTSTTTTFDDIANARNNILNYTMTAISTNTPDNFDMGGWFEVSLINQSSWSQSQLNYTGIIIPGQAPTINILKQAYTVGDYFDVKNLSGSVVLNVWNPYVSGGLILQMIPGSYYRFTYNVTGTWTTTANPTPIGTTTTNSFLLSQSFGNTIMSTNNQLLLNAAQLVVNNAITAPSAYINTLYGSLTLNSTFVGNTVSTQALTLSSINGTELTSLINPDQSYFSSITVSTQKLTASSITGLLDYNITSTIANVADILSVNNNILTANMVLTSPVPVLGMTFNFVYSDSNYEYWNNTGFKPDASYTSQIQNIQNLVTHTTGQVDFYFGFAFTVTINYPGGQTIIGDYSSGYPGQARFTFAAGAWTFTNTFSGGSVVNTNNLTIAQNIGQTVIQTSDAIVVSTSAFLTNSDMYLNKVTAQILNVSSISTGTLSIGSLSLPGNVQTAGFLSTGTNLYVGNSAIIPAIKTSSIYGYVSLMSTMVTNTDYTSLNIQNIKNNNTTAYYNPITSTFTTNAQNPIPTSASIYGNTLKYYALPGLLDTTINNGVGGNQVARFFTAGNITLNGTPAFPMSWYSSICLIYPPAGRTTILNIDPNTQGEFILQSMNLQPFYVQPYTGSPTLVSPTVIPQYWKVSFNVLSNALVNSTTPYVSTLVSENTGWGVSPNSNVNLIAKSLSYNSKFPVIFYQNFSANLNPGLGGTVAAASASNVLTYNGQNFPVNQWSCYLSFYNINLSQNNLALNNFNVTTYNSGGNWGGYCYTGTCTITGTNQQGISWNVLVMMVPKEIALQQNYNKYGDDYNPVDDLPPSTFTSTVATFGRLVMPELHLSSINASSFTFQAAENFSMNANVSTPTFLGTGNIAINAYTNIDMMANFDTNIDAGDAIYMTANSTINITSYNPYQPATFAIISNGDPFFANGTTISLENVSAYDWYYLYVADSLGTIYYNNLITIAPGGLYTFTITATIPSGHYLQVAVGDTNGNSINEILENSSGVVSYTTIGSYGANPVYVGTGTSAQPETGQINMTASTIYLQNYVDISGALCAPQLLCVSSINGVAYTGGGGGGGWVGTAESDLNMSSFKIYGSNAGNSLGNFQPFKFVYEPPTAAGQSAEFAIQAHPQDAGVVFNLRYGVDLAGGYGYLLCEWPGYIVVPMKIYGQDIALEGGETIHITAGSGNISLSASGSVKMESGYLDMNSHNITFGGSGGDVQQINTAFWANGGTAQGYGGSLYLGASNSVYFQVPVGFQNTSTPLDMNTNNINNVNDIYVNNNVRCQTLNSYPVPWVSTYNLGTLTSTYDGTSLTTPQLTGLSNIEFPYAGTYTVSRRIIQTKVSGSTPNDVHASLLLQRTSAIPTFPSNNGQWAIAYQNDNGVSSFGTAIFSVTTTGAASLPTWIYDATGHSYNVNIDFDNPVVSYIPPPSP